MEQTEFVGKVDEGVDDFFAKKVTKIATTLDIKYILLLFFRCL